MIKFKGRDTEAEALYDGEIEEVDVFLEFNEFGETSYAESEVKAANALSEYSLEEIMQMNEIDDVEMLGVLYFEGNIGLPQEIEIESDIAEMESLSEDSSED